MGVLSEFFYNILNQTISTILHCFGTQFGNLYYFFNLIRAPNYRIYIISSLSLKTGYYRVAGKVIKTSHSLPPLGKKRLCRRGKSFGKHRTDALCRFMIIWFLFQKKK